MSLKSTYSQNRLGEKSQWFTLIASTSISADKKSDIQDTPWALGVMLEVISSSGSSADFQPRLATVDDAGNEFNVWAATTAITTDTTTTYVFFPGGASGMDGVTEAVDMPLPRSWRFFLDRTGGSMTVEVHACYL